MTDIPPGELRVIPVRSIGEIRPGDDLPRILSGATELEDQDVLVVTQKVVSKAEGQIIEIDQEDPRGHKAVVEAESARILRRRGDLIISETRHGFVCANAGVDLSNVEDGFAAILPVDSDRSARRIRDVIRAEQDVEIGVLVTDTFGRPWRKGVTDVAIGSAGISPILDLRGTNDALGRELAVTEVAIVDEIAGAADLVMGKSAGYPAAIVRGIPPSWFKGGSISADIIRSPHDDLFR